MMYMNDKIPRLQIKKRINRPRPLHRPQPPPLIVPMKNLMMPNQHRGRGIGVPPMFRSIGILPMFFF